MIWIWLFGVAIVILFLLDNILELVFHVGLALICVVIFFMKLRDRS